MKPVSVSFIGAGNLAWHLAPALDNTGFAVRDVYSLHKKNALALAEKLYQSVAVDSLDFSASKAQLFIIAVPDDEISKVISQVKLPQDSILVHTSGSQPLSLLEGAAPHTGVFYPLQTFTKSRRVDFQDIPFFVEANGQATEKLLVGMAKTLSKKVLKTTSQDRRALHAAAVFASNFTNHMLTVSKEIMVKNGMNYDLLKPLIAETINKAFTLGPENSQTGPAKRGDLQILDNHFEFLQEDPGMAEVYKVVSQHILDCYNPVEGDE